LTFYLTVGEPYWLYQTRVPLMVSRRRLARRPMRLKRRTGPWVLDSGGFTELTLHGGYATTPADYAREATEYHAHIGNMQWAAIQDWMCEPHMLTRTGLTIPAHQRRTVQSYTTLTGLAPALPWLPILQGWTLADYMRCQHIYNHAGVSLQGRAVGIGSMCRRQTTTEAGEILSWAHSEGMQIHAFGFKMLGVRKYSHLLTSSDSYAWSTHARRRPALPGCTHPTCNHCLRYALQWRRRVLAEVPR
jgi:hypothetical protein